MTFKEIQELIKLVNKTNLSELKLKDGEFEISLRSKDFFRNKSVSYEGAPIMSVAPAAVPVSASTSVAPVAPAASTVSSEKPAEKSVEPASSSKTIEIKSPIVGTFYRSSSPDKPPFMKVGDDVKAGDVVCIVEAMKLFNEIESEVSGKIVKVMVEDATPVEYDQVLFLVEPA